jgi:hypothetical protein
MRRTTALHDALGFFASRPDLIGRFYFAARAPQVNAEPQPTEAVPRDGAGLESAGRSGDCQPAGQL